MTILLDNGDEFGVAAVATRVKRTGKRRWLKLTLREKQSRSARVVNRLRVAK
jgi:hypothetical protein